MDLVQRAPPGSPLHAVLDRALEQQDRQTLTLFGLQAKLPRPAAPPTDPFDLLVWLGAGEDQQRIIERVKGGDVRPRIAAGASDRSYLGHCSAVALLLSSWACDPPTIDAGLFASIFGGALHPGRFSIDVARRGMVAECVGEEAEAVAFANCALQLRALDAAVVRCRDALASAGARGGACRTAAAPPVEYLNGSSKNPSSQKRRSAPAERLHCGISRATPRHSCCFACRAFLRSWRPLT